MKQGFYMGYDASRLGEDALRRQARLLLDTGLYRAGYRTLAQRCSRLRLR